jgi:hypothetical protein
VVGWTESVADCAVVAVAVRQIDCRTFTGTVGLTVRLVVTAVVAAIVYRSVTETMCATMCEAVAVMVAAMVSGTKARMLASAHGRAPAPDRDCA